MNPYKCVGHKAFFVYKTNNYYAGGVRGANRLGGCYRINWGGNESGKKVD